MILWFSGTGNSEYVALHFLRQLREKLPGKQYKAHRRKTRVAGELYSLHGLYLLLPGTGYRVRQKEPWPAALYLPGYG